MKILFVFVVLMLVLLVVYVVCVFIDFVIQDFKVVQGVCMFMKGQVMNKCVEVVVVQISIVVKDVSGCVIQEKKGWLVGIINIVLGQVVDFDFGCLFCYLLDMVIYMVMIVLVCIW